MSKTKTTKAEYTREECEAMANMIKAAPQTKNTKAAMPDIEHGATLGVLLAKHTPQAQHSPLPWTLGLNGKFGNGATLLSNRVIGEIATVANARLIVASVNHAQALAEALQWMIERARGEKMLNDQEWTKVKRALAAWEGAK